MSLLETLDVGKRRCDRCWRWRLLTELKEDPATAGLYVCDKCADKKGFNEMKAESPRDKTEHHFGS